MVALKGSSQRCETAKIHEALGKAYEESKDYAKAKSNFTKALKIAEKLYGSRDSRVAQLVHKLGNVQRKLGDNQEALSLYQRGKASCLTLLDSSDNNVLRLSPFTVQLPKFVKTILGETTQPSQTC